METIYLDEGKFFAEYFCTSGRGRFFGEDNVLPSAFTTLHLNERKKEDDDDNDEKGKDFLLM